MECFYKGKLVAIHERSSKEHGYSTLKEHMPKNHQEHAQWSPTRLKSWAAKTGLKNIAIYSLLGQQVQVKLF